MSVRPYPSRERARRQVERHKYEVLPAPTVSLRAATPAGVQLLADFTIGTAAACDNLAANLRRVFPVDDYQLSTR